MENIKLLNAPEKSFMGSYRGFRILVGGSVPHGVLEDSEVRRSLIRDAEEKIINPEGEALYIEDQVLPYPCECGQPLIRAKWYISSGLGYTPGGYIVEYNCWVCHYRKVF